MNQEPPHEAGREEQETVIGPPRIGTTAELVCSSCGQPLESASRFCQACGTPVAIRPAGLAESEPGEEKPRPWFALVVLLWLVVMAAALYFIYAKALVVGST